MTLHWSKRNFGLFAAMAALICLVGFAQSWNVALSIVNLGLISAIMALGVNIQWGYGGLFNVGIMGFAALGGVAVVLISSQPVVGAWAAGGPKLMLSFFSVLVTAGLVFGVRRMLRGRLRGVLTFVIVIAGYAVMRGLYDPSTNAIEALNAASAGNIGGLGLPILLSWAVGGVFAAGAAWVVGKIALGLRADYLAIATLGISEIIIAVIKNEDWMTRGVKNMTGLPRPVPLEIDLQQTPWFMDLAVSLNVDPAGLSGIFVKLAFAGFFVTVLLAILWLCERALHSPWGRMMRAIRDNRDAAAAMGKDVTRRHLQIFVLGSAVVGIAGAMLVTYDGLLTPTSFNPLRYTFLIWVMVIVGGSGNNWGAVLGGFLIWFLWIEAEIMGLWVMERVTDTMQPGPLKAHLLDVGPHLRLFMMGLTLLLVLRFSPKGLIPEVQARPRH